MSKKDLRQHFLETQKNCQRYFDDRLALMRNPVDVRMSHLELDPSSSILEHADNHIMGRDIGAAPSQENV